MLVHGQSVKNCGHIRLRNFFQGIELGFAKQVSPVRMLPMTRFNLLYLPTSLQAPL